MLAKGEGVGVGVGGTGLGVFGLSETRPTVVLAAGTRLDGGDGVPMGVVTKKVTLPCVERCGATDPVVEVYACSDVLRVRSHPRRSCEAEPRACRADPSELRRRLPHHEHRTRRVAHDLLGDAAQEDAREAGLAAGSDDDELGVHRRRLADNRGRGRRVEDLARRLDTELFHDARERPRARPELRVSLGARGRRAKQVSRFDIDESDRVNHLQPCPAAACLLGPGDDGR